MQVIFEDEDEGGNSKRTGTISPFIYTGRISRYLERKHYGGIRDRRDGVRDS